MATQVKHRRGTNAEILAGTPAIGELWFNVTDNSIHMGDGVTPGGVKHINANIFDDFIEFGITHPAIPPADNNAKLIFRPTGETGFYVVSNQARGRGGFVMTLVRDDVAAVDSLNTGGASNSRPNVVNYCRYVYVANSVAYETSGDVSFLANSTYVNNVWRYREDGTNFSYFAETEDTSDNNLTNRQLYNVNSGTGTAYAEFRTSGDCTLHLGLSATSSETVEIQILDDAQTTLYIQETVSLRKTVSSPGSSRIIDIKTPNDSPYTFYRVRVVNKSVNVSEPCYIAGLNIRSLRDIKYDTYVTNAVCLRSTASPKYRNSTGANEFAAKESGGKFFGTFHGGHSNLFERLRVGNGNNYDIQADAVPALLVTDHATLYSNSTLTPDSGVCTLDYSLTVRFCDGFDVSTQTLTRKTGTLPVLSDMYTHMNTTDTDFTFVYQPRRIDAIAGGNTDFGNVQFCEQYSGALTMACTFSRVDVKRNSFSGLYIQSNANFNNQYYGPIFGGVTYPLLEGQYITCKEYF